MSVEYQWVLDEYQKNYNRAKTREGKAGQRVNRIGEPRKVTKGMLDNLVFQVNPETISWSEGATWATSDSPSRYVPLIQHGCNKPKIVSFELYVNEWMFDRKVNAELFEAELSRMANQHFGLILLLGEMAEFVVINNYEVTVESFNPDLTLREFRANLELMVLK